MQSRCDQSGSGADFPVGLGTLLWIFLGIASTSFGGFMSMVSVVQNVIVERRKLLRDDDVLDGLSLASVLPGPTAVNVAAYVGYRLRGIPGAATCVFASVLPAFVLMVVLGIAYSRWGQVPAIDKAFMAIPPVVAAIIVAAAWRMLRTSGATLQERLLTVCAAACLLVFSGIYLPLLVFGAAAFAGYRWFGDREGREPDRTETSPVRAKASRLSLFRANASLFLLAAIPAAFAPIKDLYPGPLLKLLGAFAGMSMLMFGGGYVAIPLLQKTVVESYGWVTQKEFIDAIALGQLTPGPIMISAAFIGYKVAGFAGAALATIGMFLPPAAMMTFCASLITGSEVPVNVQAALRGMRAASIGLVFAAAAVIGKSAAHNLTSLALFTIALVVLMRYRIEAVWLVPAAGILGFLAY